MSKGNQKIEAAKEQEQAEPLLTGWLWGRVGLHAPPRQLCTPFQAHEGRARPSCWAPAQCPRGTSRPMYRGASRAGASTPTW